MGSPHLESHHFKWGFFGIVVYSIVTSFKYRERPSSNLLIHVCMNTLKKYALVCRNSMYTRYPNISGFTLWISPKKILFVNEGYPNVKFLTSSLQVWLASRDSLLHYNLHETGSYVRNCLLRQTTSCSIFFGGFPLHGDLCILSFIIL